MIEIPASEVDPLFRFLFAVVAVTFALFVCFVGFSTVVGTIHFLGRWDLMNIVVRNWLISFFRRLNWPVWQKFVSHALFYGWIAGFCFAAAVLAIYYQPTLLDIWHVNFLLRSRRSPLGSSHQHVLRPELR